jgi:ABC-type Mn2+/Zn2+ transport system permease subunit
VGALLVAAIYVLPGAAARLVSKTLPALLAWSVALALAEGVTGLYVAYWLDLPPGPPVAVLGAAVYAALALGAAVRGPAPLPSAEVAQ